MDTIAPRTLGRLLATVEEERLRLAAYGEWPGGALGALWLDELWTSSALAGSTLTRLEVAALLERGVALGERTFEEYSLVADYAAAAGYVRAAAPAGRRRPYLRLQEIVDLHALAVHRSVRDRPGTWRTTTVRPFASGMVAPPAWVVPQTVAGFVDRLAAGPPAGVAPLLWVAEGHEAFERIHPFATANGRVGRLVVNLLLRRLNYPPFLVAQRDARRYVAALGRADSRDPWPLATIVARAILGALTRLAVAARTGDELRPLAALVPASERAALYKAVQRGRLRSLRRGGAVLTTRAWLETYRSERAPAGRRREGDGEERQNPLPRDADSQDPRAR